VSSCSEAQTDDAWTQGRDVKRQDARKYQRVLKIHNCFFNSNKLVFGRVCISDDRTWSSRSMKNEKFCGWEQMWELTVQACFDKVNDTDIFHKFMIVDSPKIVYVELPFIARESVALGLVEVKHVAVAVVVIFTELHTLEVYHSRNLLKWLVQNSLRSIVDGRSNRTKTEDFLKVYLIVGAL
jgi:hypothetical protein